MSISIIAAIGKNYELGKKGQLIWHFREDMAFFKKTTKGATVIMGRKTFESLPKALPGRQNIVITNNASLNFPGAETAHSQQEALSMCTGETVYIIGGAKIYDMFLPLADTLFLTEIDSECADADTYFPTFDKTLYEVQLLQTCEDNGIAFRMMKYTKKSG